jgi:hypothetical protein
MFLCYEQRLHERGTKPVAYAQAGCPRTLRTPPNEDAITAAVEMVRRYHTRNGANLTKRP